MNSGLQAIFFDVDGVLIDSLPQHLQICREKAIEYGLPIQIPNNEKFREIVRSGKKVSPMKFFFLAVGFPEEYAERAVSDYEHEFASKYQPAPFAGVEEMLAALKNAEFILGVVTSNTRANTISVLGDAMRFFHPKCRFFFDSYVPPKSKKWCLLEGARILGIPPGQCIYIGDQPADAQAARESGVQFLGVSYGWGISSSSEDIDVAANLFEIRKKLLKSRTQP